MVGLIFIGNIEYCPYIETYKKKLEEKKIPYEVLFWKREEFRTKYPDNYNIFNYPQKNNLSFKKKCLGFLKYRKWLKDVIIKKNYNKLILLSTLSGMLISDYLLFHYRKKYILDIRDYSYEDIKPFSCVESKLIDKAYMTVISSYGFKIFLPKDREYILGQNFLLNERNIDVKTVKERRNIYTVTWLGAIRYFEHQIKILDYIGNDNRFVIEYHGIGPDYERLFAYCKKKAFTNVYLTGKYYSDEKAQLLINADILLNHYDMKKGKEVKYALSNKFYDGILFNIPQLVESGSYKSRLVQKLKVGLTLEIEDGRFADKLYHYLNTLDTKTFTARCRRYEQKIIKANKNFEKKVERFLELTL